jgi:hypothetical protein
VRERTTIEKCLVLNVLDLIVAFLGFKNNNFSVFENILLNVHAFCFHAKDPRDIGLRYCSKRWSTF